MPTNADMLIGKGVRRHRGDRQCPPKHGAVTVGGKVWTARTEEPDGKAETGKVMTVVKIEGVKLIVK